MYFIISIIIFILIILLLAIIKPKFIYNKKIKKFKSFGIGKNKTLLPIPVLAIFISVIAHLVINYFAESSDIPNNPVNITNNNPINNLNNTNPVMMMGGNNPQIILPQGFDIHSIIEAGIKAKLAESANIQYR